MEIENYAYIVIKDLQKSANIFEGGCFLQAQALIMEHPINDIWLLNAISRFYIICFLMDIIFLEEILLDAFYKNYYFLYFFKICLNFLLGISIAPNCINNHL